MARLITKLVVGLFGFVGIVWFTGSVDTSQQPSFAKAMLDIAPIVFALGLVIMVFAELGGVDHVVRYHKWAAFGNRLKTAYTAKFGYPNPAFNDEVDQHIRVMRTMRKHTEALTKELSEDWLKRAARMVEVPYVIPSEEHWSEEAKTEQFDGTDPQEKGDF